MNIKLFVRLALILVVASVSFPHLLHTSEPQAEVAIEAGEISFDGKECTYSGLTELVVGEYSFVFKNQSDLDVILILARLSDGRTFQDFLGILGEPGEYVPKPDWVKYAPEPGSAQIRTDGGEVHTYILKIAGEYAIYVLIGSPFNIWVGTPLYVKEAPAE
jgi:hypothetical protein